MLSQFSSLLILREIPLSKYANMSKVLVNIFLMMH